MKRPIKYRKTVPVCVALVIIAGFPTRRTTMTTLSANELIGGFREVNRHNYIPTCLWWRCCWTRYGGPRSWSSEQSSSASHPRDGPRFAYCGSATCTWGHLQRASIHLRQQMGTNFKPKHEWWSTANSREIKARLSNIAIGKLVLCAGSQLFGVCCSPTGLSRDMRTSLARQPMSEPRTLWKQWVC